MNVQRLVDEFIRKTIILPRTPGVLLYIWFFLSNCLFLNKTLQFFMAWLCFLLFFLHRGISPDCEYIYLSSVCMSSQIRTKLFKDIRQYYYTTLVPNNDNTGDLQALHTEYIRELYKDRGSSNTFLSDLILATCYDCLDKNKKSEFLKEWGSKGCIYIIEYKYDPFIYYIGRTTLFKRRLSNHLLADSNSKLHVFLKLVGWEHFNICPPPPFFFSKKIRGDWFVLLKNRSKRESLSSEILTFIKYNFFFKNFPSLLFTQV